jgi:hypothetical protein
LRQKPCETKGLEQDSNRFKSDRALSALAGDAGELAANYQDAVKGVLTLRRPWESFFLQGTEAWLTRKKAEHGCEISGFYLARFRLSLMLVLSFAARRRLMAISAPKITPALICKA